MAILSVPFAAIYLVPHFAGGAIVHAGGGYVANTLIPAGVVEAFSVASGILSQIGSGVTASGASTASVLSSPVVIGAAAVGVVALGAYCYFHGIPAPIESALSAAGLGTTTEKGLMVSVPQLAVALILLGGAGYVSFRFYKNFRSARRARFLRSVPKAPTRPIAEAAAREAFGESVWSEFGSSLWASMDDTKRAASLTAQDAVNASATLARKLINAADSGLSHAKATYEGAAASMGKFAFGTTSTGETVGRRETFLEKYARFLRSVTNKFARSDK